MSLCSGLAGAGLTHPFGDTSATFKVSGKIFAAVSGDGPSSLITLKCDPGYAESLVSEYDDIERGYHMNKRHWISVRLGSSVPDALLRELIRSPRPRRWRPARPRTRQPQSHLTARPQAIDEDLPCERSDSAVRVPRGRIESRWAKAGGRPA